MANTRRATSTRVSDKPAPVAINLDVMEREGSPEPFVALFAGHRFEMADAMEIDWKILALAERDNRAFFRAVLSDKDFEFLMSKPMPVWKLRGLVEAYRKHFGLVADEGESGASSA